MRSYCCCFPPSLEAQYKNKSMFSNTSKNSLSNNFSYVIKKQKK